jgi:hypothetical protein
MISVILLSFFKLFKKYGQFLIACGYVVGGWGICYMLALNTENHYYYGGLFLIFFSGYFLIKLHFLWATLGGILILLFYNMARMART